MQPNDANNADSSKEPSSEQFDLTHAAERTASQTMEVDVEETSDAYLPHAIRLKDAIKVTGLGDRFDFKVDDRLIHTCNFSLDPEVCHEICKNDLPFNKLLLAARYFTADQSYEIIGFRVKLAELSNGNHALEAIIEVIAEVAVGDDHPKLNVLFEDIDDPMVFLMFPNALFEMLCEGCIENERARIDHFFDNSVHFLKQVLWDPRFTTV